MGLIISKFRDEQMRSAAFHFEEDGKTNLSSNMLYFTLYTFSKSTKKKLTIEVLEELEKEIDKLEQFRRKNQKRQKQFIGSLLLYSIIGYIVSALVFYFYYLPDVWKERLLYSIPLLLFPLLIWCVKKILHWYFVKRIAGNDLALEDLRERKKKILEDVMETETYKKAKEILEKFDPARFKEMEAPKIKTPEGTPGSELRQRNTAQRTAPGPQMVPGQTPRMRGITPIMAQQVSGPRLSATPFLPRDPAQGMQPRNILATPYINGGYGQPPGPPLPRPILPRERGTMDRLLEYLVGDGPQNRYALICRTCFSHNGMALKEEFQYIDFRCCYCYSTNPAKMKRPFAPRIEPPMSSQLVSANNDSQSEEEGSEGDADDDDGESDADDGDTDNANDVDNDDVDEGESETEGSDPRQEESMDAENIGTVEGVIGSANENES